MFWRLVPSQNHVCFSIQKYCHCTIKHRDEPGRFMLAECPRISVSNRSFCRILLSDPWPILKLWDSHCEGLSGIFYNLDWRTSSSVVRELLFKWPVSDPHPIWRRATVLPITTYVHLSKKWCCSFFFSLNELHQSDIRNFFSFRVLLAYVVIRGANCMNKAWLFVFVSVEWNYPVCSCFYLILFHFI